MLQLCPGRLIRLDFFRFVAQETAEQLSTRVLRDRVNELDAAREPFVVHFMVRNVLTATSID